MKNLKASSHERMRHPMMSELRNKLVHCLLKIELTGELRKGSLCELLWGPWWQREGQCEIPDPKTMQSRLNEDLVQDYATYRWFKIMYRINLSVTPLLRGLMWWNTSGTRSSCLQSKSSDATYYSLQQLTSWNMVRIVGYEFLSSTWWTPAPPPSFWRLTVSHSIGCLEKCPSIVKYWFNFQISWIICQTLE